MIQQTTELIQARGELVQRVRAEVGRAIVGQAALVDRLLIGLFTRGHVLIEGVPGLAKTRAVKTLSDAVSASFKRIQFTPDLLPADLTGTEIYRPKTGDFTVKKGPVFHNIVLADEINRAPSKVQSALLEAMQERQVTIGEETFPLPDPFLVLATQNPIEQEGTYPLPEAQVDRFMLKVLVGYPDKAEEKEIVRRESLGAAVTVSPVLGVTELRDIQALIRQVFVDEKLLDYVVDLVAATRDPAAFGIPVAGYIQYGASPRASIFLTTAAQAYAFLQGRGYVTPQDVKSIAPDVLRHRVLLTYEAEAEDVTPDAVIQRIFDGVPVP
ncbi:MAG: MoxR family ATPase [Deferrisomatales bacterium]|nr:MoxR family ATPase [Deferrisomatales bacterium]